MATHLPTLPVHVSPLPDSGREVPAAHHRSGARRSVQRLRHNLKSRGEIHVESGFARIVGGSIVLAALLATIPYMVTTMRDVTSEVLGEKAPSSQAPPPPQPAAADNPHTATDWTWAVNAAVILAAIIVVVVIAAGAWWALSARRARRREHAARRQKQTGPLGDRRQRTQRRLRSAVLLRDRPRVRLLHADRYWATSTNPRPPLSTPRTAKRRTCAPTPLPPTTK